MSIYTAAIPAIEGVVGSGSAAKLFGLTFSEWGTVAMGASTVMSGVQMVSGAMQAEGAAKASAEAAEQNAMQARAEANRNARVLEVRKDREQRLLTQRFEREQASRNAFFGKYGGGDSPLEILAGAAQAHEEDLLSLDYTTELDKQSVLYGGETAARSQTQQAGQYRARAQNAMSNMPWGVGETLLAGGAKTYRFYKGL